MPAWTLEELQLCRERLFPDTDEATVAERFTWFGGSIRRVLVQPRGNPEQELNTELYCGWLGRVEQLIEMMGFAMSYSFNFSHTLGHFLVRPVWCLAAGLFGAWQMDY